MNTIKQSEDTLNKSIIKDTDFIKKQKIYCKIIMISAYQQMVLE